MNSTGLAMTTAHQLTDGQHVNLSQYLTRTVWGTWGAAGKITIPSAGPYFVEAYATVQPTMGTIPKSGYAMLKVNKQNSQNVAQGTGTIYPAQFSCVHFCEAVNFAGGEILELDFISFVGAGVTVFAKFSATAIA